MSNKITRYGHKSDSQIIDSLRAENAALCAEVERLKGDFNTETLKPVVVLGRETNELRQQLAKAEADRDCWYEQSELLQHQNDEAFAELRGHIDEQEKQLAASQLEAKRLRDTMQKIAGRPEETPPFYWWQIYARNALSSPTSTEALDAYVAERIKDAHEDGHNEGLSYSAPIIAEITRQRDLAVSAIENLVKQKGRHNTEIAYKKLVDVLAAIKESEV